MKITRNNCEAFFLDYYEGNLSEGQVAELFAFLKANPDQREIFESFSNVQLEVEDSDASSRTPHSSFPVPDFSFLKKEPVADIHEQAEVWMVDSVEGTISEEDRISLEKYLNENPSKRSELAAFEKTILRADGNETIGDLSNFKKEVAITPENFGHYAVALIEGTISEKEKSLLESFVLTHPEYKAQIDAFRSSVQKADESIVFEEKASLKKSSVVVTKDNIEELLVDKVEGQLSAHDEAAVDSFVAANPEYGKDLDLLAKTKLVADSDEIFSAKDSLKRGVTLINESNFEQYLISASEGLLNREELKSFNAFAETHPKYRKALALYAATRLQPDMSVVYDDKEGLKRKERGAVIWFTAGFRYAAAAILVLVFGIYLWTKIGGSGVPDPGKQIANGNETPNNGATPFQENNTPVPNNNDLYANNTPDNDSSKPALTSGGGSRGEFGPKKDGVTPSPVSPIDMVTTRPVTILADNIPNKGNDAVSFSDALYNVLFNDNTPQQPQVKETPADEYISPGQLAMRWMKDKIDGTDPAPRQQEVWQGVNEEQKKPEDKNVSGTDLVESGVNRVGQNAANGNIAMEQRNDGTYLQLWNYEVRVAK